VCFIWRCNEDCGCASHGPVIGAAARMIISARARPGAGLNGMLSKLEPRVTERFHPVVSRI
jgi:hypothetical protein